MLIELVSILVVLIFFFSSRRRHTRCALVTGVQTCALPISPTENKEMSSINARPYESQAATEVAFLGLGVMGHPMAGNLSKAGHKVTVYNRTFAKAEAWVKEFGGTAARTPNEAVQGARLVFCCVGNRSEEHTSEIQSLMRT